MLLVKSTTEKYMPFISLGSFETQILNTDQNGISKIKIKINFSIPKLSTSVKTVEIIITNTG
jgi:hypothetical protein